MVHIDPQKIVDAGFTSSLSLAKDLAGHQERQVITVAAGTTSFKTPGGTTITYAEPTTKETKYFGAVATLRERIQNDPSFVTSAMKPRTPQSMPGITDMEIIKVPVPKTEAPISAPFIPQVVYPQITTLPPLPSGIYTQQVNELQQYYTPFVPSTRPVPDPIAVADLREFTPIKQPVKISSSFPSQPTQQNHTQLLVTLGILGLGAIILFSGRLK